MSRARVVVVGSLNVDLVVRADRLPGAGETVVGRRLERHGGGKSANAAVAAARAGAAVSFVGAVGDDAFGRDELAALAAAGVDVTHVAVLAGEATGAALIAVGADGENQIAVGAGANAAVTVGHVTAALDALVPDAGCVLVGTEIATDAALAAVAAAKAAGVPCVLDPAPVVPGIERALADGPILTPNAGECRALAGRPDGSVEDAARALTARSGAAVVVTLGGEGMLVVSAGGVERVDPVPVTVVDTTGAGDTVTGTLAACLARGASVSVAARAANEAGARAVTRRGAR